MQLMSVGLRAFNGTSAPTSAQRTINTATIIDSSTIQCDAPSASDYPMYYKLRVLQNGAELATKMVQLSPATPSCASTAVLMTASSTLSNESLSSDVIGSAVSYDAQFVATASSEEYNFACSIAGIAFLYANVRKIVVSGDNTYLLCRFNADTTKMKMYVDGKDVATINLDASLTARTGSIPGPLSIGITTCNSKIVQPSTAYVKSVRIWKGALNASQIAASATETLTLPSLVTDLVTSWSNLTLPSVQIQFAAQAPAPPAST